MAVLFDLDGTLMDTAHDFVAALTNFVRDHNYKTKLPINYASLSYLVSFGAKTFLTESLDSSIEINVNLINKFLEYYLNTNFAQSVPYPGINDLLTTIEKAKIPWGIVTNKPTRLTLPLLANADLKYQPHCVVCGDTTKRAKPHPEPLLYACEQIKTTPDKCIYIGDAERDILASNAAGMPAIAVLYGYIKDPSKARDTWPSTYFADNVLSLSDIITKHIANKHPTGYL